MLENLDTYQFILGSKSPRRKELLEKLGLTFTQTSADIDEGFPSNMPTPEIPLFLAEQKANALLSQLKENDVLITSDTIVVLDNKVLNKPADKIEATAMLEALSGKTHTVITGVQLTAPHGIIQFSDFTSVTFKQLTADEIDYYIDTCSPYDKAGSYGIQDWLGYIGVESINGCYYNVMGLPLPKLYEALRSLPQ